MYEKPVARAAPLIPRWGIKIKFPEKFNEKKDTKNNEFNPGNFAIEKISKNGKYPEHNVIPLIKIKNGSKLSR